MKRNFVRRAGALLLILSLSFTLPAQAAEAGDEASGEEPAASGVEISLSGVELINGEIYVTIDKTVKVSAVVTRDGVEMTNPTIRWTIDNTAVATVSADSGAAQVATVTTGKRIGTATLTAEVTAIPGTETGSASWTVHVTADPYTVAEVTSVELYRDAIKVSNLNYTLAPNAELNLEAVVWTRKDDSSEPEVDDTAEVIWTSSNTRVASVNNGHVVALRAGTTVITASSGGKRDQCIVEVVAETVALTGLTLNYSELTLGIDKSVTLAVTPEPSNASKNVTWSTSDDKIATVTQGGKVTGVAVGTATITAASILEGYDHITAACTVTVVEKQAVSVSAISLSQTAIQIDPGTSQTLSATIAPEEAEQGVTWASSDTAIATVEGGVVTGVYPGTCTVTATSTADANKSIHCEVTVSGVILSLPDEEKSNVVSSTAKPLSISLMAGKMAALTYTAYGAARTAGAAVWTSTDTSIASVSSGRVSARATGGVTVTLDIGGYQDTCQVTVVENTVGLVQYNMGESGQCAFSLLLTQLNTKCREATKENLSYLTALTLSPSQGILYTGYVSADQPGAAVGSGEKYYYSPGSDQKGISDITFIPAAGFSGTASIRYTGYSTSGVRYTGTILLTLSRGSDVSYSGAVGAPVRFYAQDFNTVFQGSTGVDFSYVTFTCPPSSSGVLYYNYSGSPQYAQAVTGSDRYYRERNPALDQVVFLPADSCPETVKIPYQAVANGGETYSGTVTITVAGGAQVGDVHYTAAQGAQVIFLAGDFNIAARAQIGERLDYVSFSLPEPSLGALYFQYAGGAGVTVSAAGRYYYDGDPALAEVSFVPAFTTLGTVTIPFTAYGERGGRFDGTVTIAYSEGGEGDNGGVVSYQVRAGRTVRFDGADFNEVCQELTGKGLNYVIFNALPAASQGTLTMDGAVTTGTPCYRSGSPSLSWMDFTPAAGYEGTVSLPYTGYSISGDTFFGAVKIFVYASPVEPLHYSGTSLPIDLPGEDFLRVAGAALEGGEVAWVQFTGVPDAASGRLMEGYTGYGTGTNVSAGERYEAARFTSSQFRFIPKAGFDGAVTIPYTAASVSGETVYGTATIAVSTQVSSRFIDMGEYAWAAPAVEFLYQETVVNGMDSARFGPEMSIRRCDFTLMLCRAFRFNTGGLISFDDVDPDSYYAWAVATAKALGIVVGSGGGNFLPESALTRQDAMVMVKRAMTAAGWDIAYGEGADLSGFADSGEIAPYARSAVARLVEMGLVNGDEEQRLNPAREITRAEIAVILHRMLTL